MTDNEYSMLKAIRFSDYHNEDDPLGEVWLSSVTEEFGPSAGGIMASLVAKGWAKTTGGRFYDDDGRCNLTASGLQAFTHEHDRRSRC